MRLLLIPGLVSDESVWQGQLPTLSALMPTQIAIGEADSIASMATAALAAAEGPLLLAGHSLGGRIALEMVRQAPARIRGLALLNSGFQKIAEGEAGAREMAGRHALIELARRDGMRAMGTQWLPPMLHPQRRTDQLLLEPLLAMIERCPLERYEKQTRALIGRPDASDVLGQLDCPLLVLAGREDGWSPLARQEQMAAMARHATLVCVPACGHMSTVERPDEVTAALRQWLGQCV